MSELNVQYLQSLEDHINAVKKAIGKVIGKNVEVMLRKAETEGQVKSQFPDISKMVRADIEIEEEDSEDEEDDKEEF